MSLDDVRKGKLGAGEMAAFASQSGGTKWAAIEGGTFGGQSYTVYKDIVDTDAGQKTTAVHLAVKAIKNKGIDIPEGLCVYCTRRYEAQNRAFSRDAGWKEVAIVILGNKALVASETGSLSNTKIKGFNKPTITCIHEIGHILHERKAGDRYWEQGSTIVQGKAATSGEVSEYAGKSKKEFVAEVFAGLIVGKKWSPAVLQEYSSLYGPMVP